MVKTYSWKESKLVSASAVCIEVGSNFTECVDSKRQQEEDKTRRKTEMRQMSVYKPKD